MVISTAYSQEDIIFTLLFKGLPVSFPLEKLNKDLIQDPDWGKMNTLEQLWYQGLLTPAGSGKYILHADDFYELEPDTVIDMPITQFKAEIGIREHGNVGSHNYKMV